MTFDVLAKIIPLLLFFPFFLGVVYWAYMQSARDAIEARKFSIFEEAEDGR